jgi:hypothetical protein
MASHLGGPGAICLHPEEPGTPLESYATLATVEIDVRAGELKARPGGPCGRTAQSSHPHRN